MAKLVRKHLAKKRKRFRRVKKDSDKLVKTMADYASSV